MPMSESNRELIEGLYRALDRRDGGSMAACYAPDARFVDPVFDLRGTEVGAMWRMLTSRATDLRCEASDVVADETSGSARWIARYTFTGTGRKVVNDVRSRFEFEHGLIARQVDEFPFWRWASQALGAPGLLLGWTPMVRAKVARQARANLDRFIASRAEAAA
jgi:ketosteroid isomerase-like protein